MFAEPSTAQARSESGQCPGTSPLSVADIDEVAAGIARAPLQLKLSDEQIATGVVYSSAGMGIQGRGIRPGQDPLRRPVSRYRGAA